MGKVESRNLPTFRKDIQDVIAWSEKRFGAEAADRYGVLIRRAILDVLANPTLPGASTHSGLAPGAYVYHLMFSRDRVIGRKVKHPRHIILYRYVDGVIEFARMLHDSRDLKLHFPKNYIAH